MNIKTEFEGMIDSTILKDALSALTAVVDNGTMRITNECITVKSVNPENVALVTLNLKRDAFADYNLTPGDLRVGIDFNKLRHILKLCKEDIEIEIKIDDEKMQLNSGYLSYDLPLPSLSALRKEPKVPETEFTAAVTIELEDFKQGIDIADNITGYVEIGMNSKEFFMDTESDEDKFKLVIPKEDLTLFTIGFPVGSEIKSKFSLDYLSRMTSRVVGGVITLKMSDDYVLLMSFNITTGCEVAYLLAPRLEAE